MLISSLYLVGSALQVMIRVRSGQRNVQRLVALDMGETR